MNKLILTISLLLIPILGSGQTASELYEAGQSERSSGNYQQAILLYTQALELDATLSNAYAERGYCLAQLDDYNQALENYNQAIALGSVLNPSILYLNRGWAFYNTGQKDKACIDWKKSQELGYEKVGETLMKYCNSSNE